VSCVGDEGFVSTGDESRFQAGTEVIKAVTIKLPDHPYPPTAFVVLRISESGFSTAGGTRRIMMHALDCGERSHDVPDM
jgi:hypothetical protein